MANDFYTAEEVANLLKLSKYTIYEMVKRGELSAAKVGRQLRISSKEIDVLTGKASKDQSNVYQMPVLAMGSQSPIMFIGSHDPAIESLINEYNRSCGSVVCIPAFAGSMEGLLSLHYNRADLVGCHLFDRQSESYNKETVKRLFLHEDMVICHFAKRNIGWIVPPGNPQKLAGWHDLQRRELTYVNRQKGSGTRVLLDYYMKKLKYSASELDGYNHEESTHSAVASLVATGDADFGLGTESAARAIGLDFIHLTQEQYDLVMKKTFYESEQWTNFRDFLFMETFQIKLQSYTGYDFSELGTTWEE